VGNAFPRDKHLRLCSTVLAGSRGRGLTVDLIEAAVSFAREHGATIVEGYPVEPDGPDAPPVFVFTGLASAFEAAGFVEVERRSPTRPIMRRELSA